MCDGCEPCQDCVVDGFGTQECVPEYEHTSSAGVDGAGNSVVLQGLEIDSGYWRATNTSTSILPCWNEDACAGGLTDAADYCDSGYTGPCECVAPSTVCNIRIGLELFKVYTLLHTCVRLQSCRRRDKTLDVSIYMVRCILPTLHPPTHTLFQIALFAKKVTPQHRRTRAASAVTVRSLSVRLSFSL